MFDRGIGIAGIALALIIGVLQYFLPQLPLWSSVTGIGVGVFLLGVSIGHIAASGKKSNSQPANTALLRLHTYGDHRLPDRLAEEHIFRWYILKNEIAANTPTGVHPVASISTLFITFEPEVLISTLQVRSPDMRLPQHEVKEFNQRFAIIVFADVIPAGTLEVSVVP